MLQEGLKAVREKAVFLEQELRAQLQDTRRFLEDERSQRRATEAAMAESACSLNSRLTQAAAELSFLRRQVPHDSSEAHRADALGCCAVSDMCGTF